MLAIIERWQKTVQCSLLSVGLCSRRLVIVSILTPIHLQKHLQRARSHQNWTIEQWRKVAWSDEYQLLLHHMDGQMNGCRLPKILHQDSLWEECKPAEEMCSGVSKHS